MHSCQIHYLIYNLIKDEMSIYSNKIEGEAKS